MESTIALLDNLKGCLNQLQEQVEAAKKLSSSNSINRSRSKERSKSRASSDRTTEADGAVWSADSSERIARSLEVLQGEIRNHNKLMGTLVPAFRRVLESTDTSGGLQPDHQQLAGKVASHIFGPDAFQQQTTKDTQNTITNPPNVTTRLSSSSTDSSVDSMIVKDQEDQPSPQSYAAFFARQATAAATTGSPPRSNGARASTSDDESSSISSSSEDHPTVYLPTSPTGLSKESYYKARWPGTHSSHDGHHVMPAAGGHGVYDDGHPGACAAHASRDTHVHGGYGDRYSGSASSSPGFRACERTSSDTSTDDSHDGDGGNLHGLRTTQHLRINTKSNSKSDSISKAESGTLPERSVVGDNAGGDGSNSPRWGSSGSPVASNRLSPPVRRLYATTASSSPAPFGTSTTDAESLHSQHAIRSPGTRQGPTVSGKQNEREDIHAGMQQNEHASSNHHEPGSPKSKAVGYATHPVSEARTLLRMLSRTSTPDSPTLHSLITAAGQHHHLYNNPLSRNTSTDPAHSHFHEALAAHTHCHDAHSHAHSQSADAVVAADGFSSTLQSLALEPMGLSRQGSMRRLHVRCFSSPQLTLDEAHSSAVREFWSRLTPVNNREGQQVAVRFSSTDEWTEDVEAEGAEAWEQERVGEEGHEHTPEDRQPGPHTGTTLTSSDNQFSFRSRWSTQWGIRRSGSNTDYPGMVVAPGSGRLLDASAPGRAGHVMFQTSAQQFMFEKEGSDSDSEASFDESALLDADIMQLDAEHTWSYSTIDSAAKVAQEQGRAVGRQRGEGGAQQQPQQQHSPWQQLLSGWAQQSKSASAGDGTSGTNGTSGTRGTSGAGGSEQKAEEEDVTNIQGGGNSTEERDGGRRRARLQAGRHGKRTSSSSGSEGEMEEDDVDGEGRVSGRSTDEVGSEVDVDEERQWHKPRHRSKHGALKRCMSSCETILVDVPLGLHPEEQKLKGGEYKLLVVTADKLGAGIGNSQVTLEILGLHGVISQQLPRPKGAFQRGSRDLFRISSDYDVGDVVAVKVWHDAPNIGSVSWCLERVELESMLRGTKYTFLNPDREGWVSKGQGNAVMLKPQMQKVGDVEALRAEQLELKSQLSCNQQLTVEEKAVIMNRLKKLQAKLADGA